MGNATEIRPLSGFSSKDVAVFFDQSGGFSENSSSSHLRGGGIAGAVVGSVAGAGIVGAGLAVLLARRKKKAMNTTPKNTEIPAVESQFGSRILPRVLFRNRGRNAE